MTSKEFNNLEEIQKYYDEESNTYVFKENEKFIDLIKLNFDLNVEANIRARDINAHNIYARNINAWDINAWNIKARYIHINGDINAYDINADNIKAKDIGAYDIKAGSIDANNIIAHDIIAHDIYAKDISYWAVCSVYYNITCKSIKGRSKNAKHFVLDGELEVLENE